MDFGANAPMRVPPSSAQLLRLLGGVLVMAFGQVLIAQGQGWWGAREEIPRNG
jgi:hypothetical protein